MAMLSPLPCLAGTGDGEKIPIDLTFPQAAVADVNTIYIPFTLVGQLMMVEAKVDTLSGRFIVDTGSERLVINKQHYTPRPGGLPVVTAGNTGLVNHALGQDVDSLRIQLLVMRNLYAHVVDLGHIETKKNTRITGILGYDVFKGFELFIDFPNRRIVLFRLNSKGARIENIQAWEQPYDSMSFSLKQHLIVVDAYVNTARVKFILDSGAELNLIDRRINRKVVDNFDIIKRVNLVGVGKKEVEVLAGTLRDVHCGNQVTGKMNTLLTSLDHINAAFNVQADGVMGYEFLKSRRTLINYTKRKIYFFKPIRS
jgi:hypothetical protein